MKALKTENNIIGKLEAMLFASGEPVEAARLAEVLELDVEISQKCFLTLPIHMTKKQRYSAYTRGR